MIILLCLFPHLVMEFLIWLIYDKVDHMFRLLPPSVLRCADAQLHSSLNPSEGLGYKSTKRLMLLL